MTVKTVKTALRALFPAEDLDTMISASDTGSCETTISLLPSEQGAVRYRITKTLIVEARPGSSCRTRMLKARDIE